MKRAWVLVLAGFVVVAAAAATLGVWASGDPEPAPTTHYVSKNGVKVTVTKPRTNAAVTSPVQILGQVPGLWTFEASFGVEVVDSHHKKLGEHYATVQGDWMTDKDVPFSATVKFSKADTDTGFVVLHNANPSADEGKDDSVEIPIRFAD